MTKLKTLKDLTYITNEIGRTDPYELKQEAIKWVKESDKKGMDREFNDKYPCWDYGADTRGFIKHFFNISEEDLK